MMPMRAERLMSLALCILLLIPAVSAVQGQPANCPSFSRYIGNEIFLDYHEEYVLVTAWFSPVSIDWQTFRSQCFDPDPDHWYNGLIRRVTDMFALTNFYIEGKGIDDSRRRVEVTVVFFFSSSNYYTEGILKFRDVFKPSGGFFDEVHVYSDEDVFKWEPTPSSYSSREAHWRNYNYNSAPEWYYIYLRPAPTPTPTGDIWTDRGGRGLNSFGGTYRVGDSISIYFKVSADSRVRVVDEYPNGSSKILFDDQVIGGKEYKLSGEMGEPAGYRIFRLIANGREVDSSRVEVLSAPECSVTTDKPKYVLGENVRIKISPTPAFGVRYWLKIYMPNGKELKEIDCQVGINVYELGAGPVPGLYKVELWSSIVYPNATPEMCASTQYEVIQPEYVKFRGVVQKVSGQEDIEISINEVLHDPEEKLKPGDTAHLDIAEENCNVSWPLQEGDIVEIYARHYVYNYQWTKSYSIGVWVYSRDNPYDGYVKKIGEAKRNEPPVAVLKAYPQNVNTGESIRFDASGSYDPDGRVVEYYFDFGDGKTHGWTRSPIVSYSYSQEDTYKARVKVKDDKGAESGWSYVDVHVSAKRNKPPVAYIDSITPNPATQGQTVQFRGHGYDEDGKVVGCEWRSSIDGLLSSSCSFETSKLSVGMHTIYFRVKDDQGEWSESATATLEVKKQEERSLEAIAEKFRKEGENYLIFDVKINGIPYKVILYYDKGKDINSELRKGNINGALVVNPSDLSIIPYENGYNEVLIKGLLIKSIGQAYFSYSSYDFAKLYRLSMIEAGLSIYMYYGIKLAWTLVEIAISGGLDLPKAIIDWGVDFADFGSKLYFIDDINRDIIMGGVKLSVRVADGIDRMHEIYKHIGPPKGELPPEELKKFDDLYQTSRTGVFIGKIATDLVLRNDLQAQAVSWLAAMVNFKSAMEYEKVLSTISSKKFDDLSPDDVQLFLSLRVIYAHNVKAAFWHLTKMHKYLLDKGSIWAMILNSKDGYKNYYNNFNVWSKDEEEYLHQEETFYDLIDRLCKTYRG